MTAILVASLNQVVQEQWEAILTDLYSVTMVSQWDALLNTAKSETFVLIVVDCDLLNDNFNEKIGLLQSNSPKSKILLVGNGFNESRQVEAFSRGIPGYMEFDAAQESLSKAVEKLLAGEIWIGRQTVTALLDNFRRETLKITDTKNIKGLSGLTPRELDITKRVCYGENNKRIAKRLNISERTVKAHLSSIFRKFELTDRLQLAVHLKGHDFS